VSDNLKMELPSNCIMGFDEWIEKNCIHQDYLTVIKQVDGSMFVSNVRTQEIIMMKEPTTIIFGDNGLRLDGN